MDFLKHQLWPALKVRLTYWWWILKYGSKKNIPRELIFARMARSMERMNENLMQALRHLPANAAEDEKRELMEAIRGATRLEDEVERVRQKTAFSNSPE